MFSDNEHSKIMNKELGYKVKKFYLCINNNTMHVKMNIVSTGEYFNETQREIDWEENDDSKISLPQEEAVGKILSTECAIHVLRGVTGLCQSVSDNMVRIRREFIDAYEEKYEKYIEYNDFW